MWTSTALHSLRCQKSGTVKITFMFFFPQIQSGQKRNVIILQTFIFQSPTLKPFEASNSHCIDIKTFQALVKDPGVGPWYPAVRWSGNVIGFVYSFSKHSFVLT